MSEDNTPKAGLDEASLDAILPSWVATTRYQDSAKQALIRTVKGGDNPSETIGRPRSNMVADRV